MVLQESDLSQFSGTEQWHKHMGLLLTDGMKYLADNGECCKRDSGEPNLVEQRIEYTDFPLPEYEFYVIHDGGSNPPVALLKGEY